MEKPEGIRGEIAWEESESEFNYFNYFPGVLFVVGFFIQGLIEFCHALCAC